MTALLRPRPAAFLALSLLALAFPLHVAKAQIGPVIRVEVLDGGATATGTQMAGLHLTLEPGWKTYWRSPGDAGIPPQFSWAGSENLHAVAITWPTPETFDQSGLRSIGYKGAVTLPLTLTPKHDGPIRLAGRIELGVCKDICLPTALEFDSQLNPDSPRNGVIAAAMAARPFSASEAGVRAATCKLRPTGEGVEIEARITMPSAGASEVVVIEPANPHIWTSEAETRRNTQQLTATAEMIHVDEKPITIDRSALRITVLGSDHAVDIRGCQPG